MQQMIHRDRMLTRLVSKLEGGRSQSAAISRSQLLLGGALCRAVRLRRGRVYDLRCVGGSCCVCETGVRRVPRFRSALRSLVFLGAR